MPPKPHLSPKTMRSSDFSARLSSALNASSAAGKLREDLREFTAAQLEYILAHWPLWARADQLPPTVTPDGEAWRVWLILGGRGAGKTRAGAEWVRAQALGARRSTTRRRARIALVGETLADVRAVMIEGVSGLLAVHARERAAALRALEAAAGVAERRGGADVLGGGSRQPARAAVRRRLVRRARQVAASGATWDMLQFGLRLGDAAAGGGDDDAAADRRC